MKRRLVAVALTAILALSMLAGCGGGGDSSGGGGSSAGDGSSSAGGTEDNGTAEVTPGGWEGDTSHIIMTYMTLGSTPADLQKVQDAVNEITVPDIGVEVEFKTIAIFDATAQYPLWVSGGEQVDLMMIAFANVASFADQGLIEPLDALIEENAPYIKSQIDAGYPLLDGTYYMDEAYGVAPLMYYYGTGGQLIIPDEYIEGANLDIPSEPIGLDGVDSIFAQLKEVYPDKYPCGFITAQTGTTSNFGYMGGVFDTLGATASSGVLMGTDSTEVVNLYGTDEYYEYLTHVKKWFDAGYIYPDSATTDSTGNELTSSGVLLTESMTSQPVMVSDMASALHMPCTGIKVGESYYPSQSSSGGTFWTVPITAADPAAAMRFLDYTFSNHDLHNLILWGIEGEHFVVEDADKYLIGFPDGIDGTTSGYYNTLGLYGDRRYEYVWDPANSKDANQAYTDEAMANPTQAVGYAFDTTAQASRIANVDAVLQKYLPTLESGSEPDLDTMYQEFLAELEAAGINDIIDDNQAQFDAWRAEQ